MNAHLDLRSLLAPTSWFLRGVVALVALGFGLAGALYFRGPSLAIPSMGRADMYMSLGQQARTAPIQTAASSAYDGQASQAARVAMPVRTYIYRSPSWFGVIWDGADLAGGPNAAQITIHRWIEFPQWIYRLRGRLVSVSAD